MTPASLLTHPVVIISVAAVVINDHWAKAAWSNHLTGKVSDAAGSLVLAALLAVGFVVIRRRWPGSRSTPATITTAVAAVAATSVVVGVALAKTSAAGAHVAAWILGFARWPIDVAGALVRGNPVALPSTVSVVVDATDVLAGLIAFVLVGVVATNARTVEVAEPDEIRRDRLDTR